jgi:LacI family transcriptional regulator
MAYNIKDVAKRAEVSPATVSLALNNSELVNKETQKKIKMIAEEMGYKPNPYAQKLVLKRSKMIGLIIPDIQNVYYAVLVHHITMPYVKRATVFQLQCPTTHPKMKE